MRNFLGMLGKIVWQNRNRTGLGVADAPGHTAFLEAQMNCAFDIDSIWFYERLKWQTRD